MSDNKSKFSTPVKFPATVRATNADLRALSSAVVGAVFNAEIPRLVIDSTNAKALQLFRLSSAEHDALPPLNVHPDSIVDRELKASVQADSGWYRRYEDQHRVDHTSEKDLKTWLLSVLPADVYNKCVTDAGGEGMELRPSREQGTWRKTVHIGAKL